MGSDYVVKKECELTSPGVHRQARRCKVGDKIRIEIRSEETRLLAQGVIEKSDVPSQSQSSGTAVKVGDRVQVILEGHDHFGELGQVIKKSKDGAFQVNLDEDTAKFRKISADVLEKVTAE